MVEKLKTRQIKRGQEEGNIKRWERETIKSNTHDKLRSITGETLNDYAAEEHPQTGVDPQKQIDKLQIDQDKLYDIIRDIADDMFKNYEHSRHVTLTEINSKLNQMNNTSSSQDYFENVTDPMGQLISLISGYAKTFFNTCYKRNNDHIALATRRVSDTTFQLILTKA